MKRNQVLAAKIAKWNQGNSNKRTAINEVINNGDSKSRAIEFPTERIANRLVHYYRSFNTLLVQSLDAFFLTSH